MCSLTRFQAVAVIGGFFLPNTPLTTRWLTPEERQLAYDRIQRDLVNQAPRGSTLDGLKQAASDYRVWICETLSSGNVIDLRLTMDFSLFYADDALCVSASCH